MIKNVKEKLYKHTNGFTLAEVLITLVVIGVVASMTVPTLIANHNQKSYQATLRKNYSVLQQASTRYYIDNGEYFTFDFEGEDEYNNVQEKYKNEFLLKYLNVAKNCSVDSCYDKPIEYSNLNGTSKKSYNVNKYGIILTDGSLINTNANFADEDKTRASLFFRIDVNGAYKKPNTFGKDFFEFEIRSDGKIIPGGSEGSYYEDASIYCNEDSEDEANGIGCTYEMLKEK